MMKTRHMLGAAALLALLGLVPPPAEAAAKPGPFRYTVVTANDDPQYIKLGRPKQHRLRQTGMRRNAKRRPLTNTWM